MRAHRKSARRRSSHLTLVQTLPTRPPLHRRLLRLWPKAGIVLACSLLAMVVVQAVRLSEPQPTTRMIGATPASQEKNESVGSAERTRQLASTQQHVLMARVY